MPITKSHAKIRFNFICDFYPCSFISERVFLRIPSLVSQLLQQFFFLLIFSLQLLGVLYVPRI